MNAKLFLSTVCLAAALAGCSSTGSSDGPTQAAPPDEAEMKQKWMEFATPGPAHQALNDRAGRWNLVVRMFQPGMAEPMESTATSETRWIMDGRYLFDDTVGDFMGQTFRGQGLLGYDNIKKCYVGSWIDNMGTGLATSEGQFDPKTKTFTYKSAAPDVMSGKYKPARSTERIVDGNHWVMQMFQEGPDGKEAMMMEIEYTRAN